MTADELRELLKGVPDDMEVVVWRPAGGYCAIAPERVEIYSGDAERLPPPKSSGIIPVVEYPNFPGVYRMTPERRGEQVFVLAPEHPGPW